MLENINIAELTSQEAQELMKKISGNSNPKAGYRRLMMKLHPDRYSNIDDKKMLELILNESKLLNQLWTKTGL